MSGWRGALEVALGDEHHQRANDHRDGHRERAEQQALDLLAEEQPDHGSRDEGDRHAHQDLAGSRVAAGAFEQVEQVAREEDDDGENGTQLDEDLEGRRGRLGQR